MMFVACAGVAIGSSWCLEHSCSHLASVMIDYNGIQHCALLDTGALISCVTAQFLVHHPCQVSPANFTISGFGSDGNPILGCVELDVLLPGGAAGQTHIFTMVETVMMPFCVILGADYLISNDISLDFSSNERRQHSQVLFHFSEGVLPERSEARGFVLHVNLSLPTLEVCIGSPSHHLTFGVDLQQEVGPQASHLLYLWSKSGIIRDRVGC